MITVPFDNDSYIAARAARLRNLFLHLNPKMLTGRRVLETGSGTGEMGEVFVKLGCQVVSVDARAEYVQELRRRFPRREAYTMNLDQAWDCKSLGRFDIVFCFGLLYHLSHPDMFLTTCSEIAPMLLLETMVSDLIAPACPIYPDPGTDQSFVGFGVRPSPAWIQQTLSRLGFTVWDISGSDANWGGTSPAVFDWVPRDDGSWNRAGLQLRKMYIGVRN